jgi:hypothetical protein
MTKNKKQNKEQKKEKRKRTWKENEVCLFFPNFKPASNQTKIKIFLLLWNILEKLEFFEKEKRN